MMKRRRKVELLPSLVELIAGDTADLFILFVDLCGSTQYKHKCMESRQPDLTWIFRQLFFLQRAAGIVKKHNGTVVKTIGDEILAVFEATTDPEEVLKCAVQIIQAFENVKAYKNSSRIEVKASIDFGLTYNGSILDSVQFDPIGLSVDRCARLNSLAQNSEILFSEDFLSLVETKPSRKQFKAKYGYKEHSVDLKGFGETVYFSILAK